MAKPASTTDRPVLTALAGFILAFVGIGLLVLYIYAAAHFVPLNPNGRFSFLDLLLGLGVVAIATSYFPLSNALSRLFRTAPR